MAALLPRSDDTRPLTKAGCGQPVLRKSIGNTPHRAVLPRSAANRLKL